MSNTKMFLSVLLGVFANIIIGIPAFIAGIYINRNKINNYLYNVAIALDELGGTLLYNRKDKTVSYMTGYYCVKGYRMAIIFAYFIDTLFGKNHCINEYIEKSLKE